MALDIKSRLLKYGLSKEEAEIWVEKRRPLKCDLCDYNELLTNLVIDHCHQTNRVRGLLCYKCNTALGKLGDNIEGLTKAIKYLSGELDSFKK